MEVQREFSIGRIRAIALELAEVMAACTPSEWEAGVTLALATYYKAYFPQDLEEVLKLHQLSLTNALEEADKAEPFDVSALKIKAEDLM